MTDPVIDAFHRRYYDAAKAGGTWADTRFLGVPVLKCPLDLWLYQEILHEAKPDLVIETGTYAGGSALYLASILALMGHGRVLTIDSAHRPGRPTHPRLDYFAGDSTGPYAVSEAQRRAEGKRTLVILDSDHQRAHVRKELDAYSPLVSVGSYLVVEDTNIHGHPVCSEHGPGPREALDEWLPTTAGRCFEVDPRGDKFMLTFNPGGVLRRKVWSR